MRALISVSNKQGIVEFAKELFDLGVEIISTGGTYRTLQDAGIEAIEVSELTQFPECLDGRVKTLHPAIHAGILAIRDKKEHQEQLQQLQIQPIDFVIVNLYPFQETILKENVSFSEAIENIDIGGPTMLRAAAKNYQDVTVVVDPDDYENVILELKQKHAVSLETKSYLMQKVFQHTAHYDTLIANHFKKEEFPPTFTATFEKVQDMRYGENPHQRAAFYKEIGEQSATLANALQLNGKELSFNNINDTNGALLLAKEFTEPTIVACKHGNPCGVGSSADETLLEAWEKAYSADPVSIYGGIVVANRPISLALAKKIKPIFLEVLVAPAYDQDALALLKEKKNLRILQLKQLQEALPAKSYDFKKVAGGLLVQTIDHILWKPEQLQVVTEQKPTEQQMRDLEFAWKVVKFVKSNGIALAKQQQTIGIGPGQVNRIWALKQCIDHAKELLDETATQGAVLASDAYFPFDDCVEVAHQAGIQAIIQPGGSIRDEDSIRKCNEYGIAMVFTGIRHFKH